MHATGESSDSTMSEFWEGGHQHHISTLGFYESCPASQMQHDIQIPFNLHRRYGIVHIASYLFFICICFRQNHQIELIDRESTQFTCWSFSELLSRPLRNCPHCIIFAFHSPFSTTPISLSSLKSSPPELQQNPDKIIFLSTIQCEGYVAQKFSSSGEIWSALCW